MGGKPLVAHTIEAALESGVFGEVLVTSEDPEILVVSRDFGAVAEVRPVHLAGDDVRIVQVLRWLLEEHLPATDRSCDVFAIDNLIDLKCAEFLIGLRPQLPPSS